MFPPASAALRMWRDLQLVPLADRHLRRSTCTQTTRLISFLVTTSIARIGLRHDTAFIPRISWTVQRASPSPSCQMRLVSYPTYIACAGKHGGIGCS